MEIFSSYQLILLIAGFVYIVTPGPVFLAIITLVSSQGTQAGSKFITGAIFGCMIWLTFTCASLIEADRLPHILFKILALLCALYLFYLGGKMVLKARKKSEELIFRHPFRDGFFLALLNPKSYPVMTAVFGAVSFHYEELLRWKNFPEIFWGCRR